MSRLYGLGLVETLGNRFDLVRDGTDAGDGDQTAGWAADRGLFPGRGKSVFPSPTRPDYLRPAPRPKQLPVK